MSLQTELRQACLRESTLLAYDSEHDPYISIEEHNEEDVPPFGISYLKETGNRGTSNSERVISYHLEAIEERVGSSPTLRRKYSGVSLSRPGG